MGQSDSLRCHRRRHMRRVRLCADYGGPNQLTYFGPQFGFDSFGCGSAPRFCFNQDPRALWGAKCYLRYSVYNIPFCQFQNSVLSTELNFVSNGFYFVYTSEFCRQNKLNYVSTKSYLETKLTLVCQNKFRLRQK